MHRQLLKRPGSEVPELWRWLTATTTTAAMAAVMTTCLAFTGVLLTIGRELRNTRTMRPTSNRPLPFRTYYPGGISRHSRGNGGQTSSSCARAR